MKILHALAWLFVGGILAVGAVAAGFLVYFGLILLGFIK